MLDITITFTINKTDYKTYESIITDFESEISEISDNLLITESNNNNNL